MTLESDLYNSGTNVWRWGTEKRQGKLQHATWNIDKVRVVDPTELRGIP